MACIYIPTPVVGLIKVILIGFMFSCVSFMVTFFFAKQTIIDNWGKYKCNPLIIPFANIFGHDPGETLTECMSKQAFAVSALVGNPLTNTFKSMSGALSGAQGMVTELDFVSGGMTNMFTSSFGKILNSIGNIGSAIQYLIIKIETLLQRIIAVVTVIMYTMSSLLQGVLALKRDDNLLDTVDTILSFPSF